MTHLLIIDNDLSHTRRLSEQLVLRGFSVLIALDGRQGIALAQKQLPDVIILDTNLAEVDGYEVIQQLRMNALFENVPFIFLSRNYQLEDIRQGMNAGADDYLSKDCEVDCLTKAINTRLKRRKSVEQQFQMAVSELRQRNLQLEVLNRVSNSVSSSLQLEAVLAEVARLSCETIGATSAYICDVDLNLGTSTVLAEHFSAEASAAERDSDLGHIYVLEEDFPTLAEWVCDPRNDFIGHFDSPDLATHARDEMAQYGLKSRLSVPLSAGDRPFGYIEIWETREKRVFTQAEIELIHSIANQAAMGIANAQLHQSVQAHVHELEALNEELDAYAHMIAHDLKNPLTVIQMQAASLKRYHCDDDKSLERRYQVINRSVTKMNEMIDQLLHRASLTDISEELHIVDMKRVAESAVSRFTDSKKAQQITITIQEDLPSVVGLAMELEEVLANLVGNAIKYMNPDHPKPQVTIRGQQWHDGIRYEVIDTGLGISREDQEALFEKFSRFHSSMAPGFGIGLSIVHRIVTKLGGRVGVESIPMEGSTFWFTLPQRDLMLQQEVILNEPSAAISC